MVARRTAALAGAMLLAAGAVVGFRLLRSVPAAPQAPQDPQDRETRVLAEPVAFGLPARAPQMLAGGEGHSVRVDGRQLVLEAAGRRQVLYRWPWDGHGLAWYHAGVLLAGASPGPPGDEDRRATPAGGDPGSGEAPPPVPRESQWILVRLPATGSGAPQVEILGSIFPPDEVDGVRVADPPGVWLLVSGPQEYAVLPGGQGATYVSWHAPELEAEDLPSAVPAPAGGRLEAFHRVRAFPQPEGSTLWLLEDDRGTVLYRTGPRPFVMRFFLRGAEAARTVPTLEGPTVPLVHLRRADGRPVLVRAAWDYVVEMDFHPALWEDGWVLYDGGSLFYRTVPGGLEVAAPVGRHTEEPAPLRLRRIDAAGAKPAGREDGLLLYDREGERLGLAPRDAAFTRPDEASALRADELWLRPLPGSPRPGRRPLPYRNPPTVTMPAPPDDEPDWAAVPRPLADALRADDGGGDYVADYRVFRDETGTWWGLRDEELFRYAAGTVERVGHLPVTVRRAGSLEGVVGHTAGALLHREGTWYVADTFADRVLKLDDRLRVVAERRLPGPFALALLPDGTLQVEGLSGRTLLTPDLELRRHEPLPWTEAPPARPVEVEPGEALEDPATGLRWLYRQGYLHQFDPRTGRWRRLYVGPPRRLESGADLAARGDRVLVLFDDRVLAFARDGAWQRTASLPYPQDEHWDCTPVRPVRAVDAAGRTAYGVQGCRVVAADVDTGQVRTLFHQLGVQLGPLALHGDAIYLTLHHGTYGDESPFTELLAVRLDGRVRRWRVPGYFALETVTPEGELVLWSYDEPRYLRETGREWRVPAAALAGP